MGILDQLAERPASSTSNTRDTGNNGGNGRPERKPSQIWLNVGANIVGAGQDGEDLFVSLPSGLPLDDMKPVRVSGTNENSIQLKQVKNTLLDELQKLGASMKPGERKIVPLSVEIYRVAQPEQIGTLDNNPLLTKLFGALRGEESED